MPETISISTPLKDEILKNLKAGDRVLISGVIYSARDAAHKRLVELISEGEKLPFDIKGQVVYYVGPTPPGPGMVIGSAGPTSSYRMDPYAPILIAEGLKGMIGKGARNQEVIEAIKKHGAVYFAATGGAGALISRTIKKADIVVYEDLGTEAIRRMQVEAFPAIVVNDIYGNDLYQQGRKRYRKIG
jgi:fumarate hydratase subunit beta